MRLSRLTSPWLGAARRRPALAIVCALAATALAAGAGAWYFVGRTHRPDVIPPTPFVGPPHIVAAAKPSKPVTFAQGCATVECHAALLATPFVHKPVADARCQECHAADTGKHVFPVSLTGAESCSKCHARPADSRHARGAESDNDCLSCHDPHGGVHKGMLAGDTAGAACRTCHVQAEGGVQHASYRNGRCGDCHDSHAPNGDLRAREQAACEHCHVDIGRLVEQGSRPHGDLARGCVSCHTPHAGDFKGLLTAEPRDMCISCHAEVGNTAEHAAVSHGALVSQEQCLACHDPHSGRNGAMLRDEQTAVCLRCHDKPITATDGRRITDMSKALAEFPVRHGPVASGNCGACHNIHGSKYQKLLRQDNAAPLGPFEIRNYGLCFSCHDRDLVLADGPAATQFRNGTTNLHRLHVQRGEKIHACATCHTVHGGTHPRLIADTVAYEGSDWKAPMGFVPTQEGGSCSPGCHAPMNYSRRTAAPNSIPQGGVP